MELTIQLASPEEAMMLFGLEDRNLKLLRERLPVELTARGEVLRLKGDSGPVRQAATLMNDMVALVREGLNIAPDYLQRRLESLSPPPDVELDGAVGLRDAPGGDGSPAAADNAAASSPRQQRGNGAGKQVVSLPQREFEGLARSKGQGVYIDAILKNDVVFCRGPAGTGKTFLSVRMAVSFLREGQIRKIILCRPAVEAGEKLGFLPGDFQAKINPYLRPLHDALNEILSFDQVKRYMEREIIEIIPLAYMRGRTLNDAFIILDEGQNTTASQMKMFLTRLGMGSKIVVNGDTTQVDLPEGKLSGLVHIHSVLKGVAEIGSVELHGADIVRHPLVKRIVEAYDKSESRPPGASGSSAGPGS